MYYGTITTNLKCPEFRMLRQISDDGWGNSYCKQGPTGVTESLLWNAPDRCFVAFHPQTIYATCNNYFLTVDIYFTCAIFYCVLTRYIIRSNMGVRISTANRFEFYISTRLVTSLHSLLTVADLAGHKRGFPFFVSLLLFFQ